MRVQDNPCNGCVPPKRHLGCHDRCPDRAEWLGELELSKKYMKKEMEDLSAITDYSQQSWRRVGRRFRR